jgi:hypothetical protein
MQDRDELPSDFEREFEAYRRLLRQCDDREIETIAADMSRL